LPLDYIAEARALCDDISIAFHCDGARLWNAAVGLGLPPAEIARHFDTLSVCLSKGLAAPVGSVIVGSQEFVHQARRARKLLGGGMRQAGILAAAGIIALTDMQERLAEDHENAKHFAQGLEEAGYRVTHPVQSNLVIFEQATDVPSPAQRSALWKKLGLLISPIGGQRFRAVTHYGIERADIEEALQIVKATTVL
jgi:threonine aldolase